VDGFGFGYQSPLFKIFGYGLDMEFMKKIRIQSDCKISLSVHHCKVLKVVTTHPSGMTWFG